MHSPPITPAATRSRDQDSTVAAMKHKLRSKKMEAAPDHAAVTPQISSPTNSLTTQPLDSSIVRVSSGVDIAPTLPALEKIQQSPSNSIRNQAAGSVAQSRNSSPRYSPTLTFSQPFSPVGDVNDPYAANKRAPQNKNLDTLDERFKFTAIRSKSRLGTGTFFSDPLRLRRSPIESGRKKKKGPRRNRENQSGQPNAGPLLAMQKHVSVIELRRFFNLRGGEKSKHAKSPSTPSMPIKYKNKALQTLHWRNHQLPFSDDHLYHCKHGKNGDILGEGAGGSVHLMMRYSDKLLFAVKEFRARHSYETEKEYTKKVTAEFCIGSTLKHGNIIKTLDIVFDNGKWYQIMEYAPYDLFAIVMSGDMDRREVNCSFLQILNGVTFLHSMGLAHRDLKLDNVVVTAQGIMKIIDFGSASVFKYPFETGIIKSSGIVGSDPYLAPEVYEERKYDPQPTDIWSLGIIYCCMFLRRFPWKIPRTTDNSYKLFASPPTPGTELKTLVDDTVSTKSLEVDEEKVNKNPKIEYEEKPSLTRPIPISHGSTSTAQSTRDREKKSEVIRGPWRLLRLLPRETRFIIGRMLEINWQKRALMSEILEDPWVSGTPICAMNLRGNVFKIDGHNHIPPTTKTKTGHLSSNQNKQT